MSSVLPLGPTNIERGTRSSRDTLREDLALVRAGLEAADLECEHLAAAHRVRAHLSSLGEVSLVVSPRLQRRADALLGTRRRLARGARRLHDFVVATVHGGGVVDATEAHAFGRLATSLEEGTEALRRAELDLLMYDHWTDVGLSGCG